MDFKWVLLSLVLFSHSGWSQASAVDGHNIQRIWRCQAKYSGRVVTIRALLSDSNPLLFVEADGQERFLTAANSLEQGLFKRNGNIHWCFTDQRKNLYYFQMMESLYFPDHTSKVVAELQRYPNYSGADSCKGLDSAGGFDQSDYMECDAFPHQYSGDGYSGPFAMKSSAQYSDSEKLGENATVQRVRVGQNGQVYTLLRADHNSALKVSDGASARSYYSDSQLTKKIADLLGVRDTMQYLEFEDVALDDSDRVFLSASVFTKRGKTWFQLPLVVRLTSDGQLDSAYGVKGIARLTKDFMSTDNGYGESHIESIGKGRIVAVHAETDSKHVNGGRISIVDADGTRNGAFKKNMEANPDWSGLRSKISMGFKYLKYANGRIGLAFNDNSKNTSYNFDLGVDGVENRDFFKEIYEGKCNPEDVKPGVSNAWVFLVYCSDIKSYAFMKTNSRGEIDRKFGNNGVAPAPKATGIDSERGDFVEASDGSILMSTVWQGKMTGYYLSGLTRLTVAGQLDTAFGNSGFYSGGPTAGSVSNKMLLVRTYDSVAGLTTVWDNKNGKQLLERRYAP